MSKAARRMLWFAWNGLCLPPLLLIMLTRVLLYWLLDLLLSPVHWCSRTLFMPLFGVEAAHNAGIKYLRVMQAVDPWLWALRHERT